MGAMKDLAIQFCEAVFPDDFKMQDELMGALISGENDPHKIAQPTAQKVRDFYMAFGKLPSLTTEDIAVICQRPLRSDTAHRGHTDNPDDSASTITRTGIY